MPYDNPPFVVRRGNDRQIEIDFIDSDPTVAGTTIRLTYGQSPNGPAVKTLTEADLTLTSTKATYRMPAAETLALVAYSSYWLQCRVTYPDDLGGFVEDVMIGSFTVEQSQG